MNRQIQQRILASFIIYRLFSNENLYVILEITVDNVDQNF